VSFVQNERHTLQCLSCFGESLRMFAVRNPLDVLKAPAESAYSPGLLILGAQSLRDQDYGE